MNEDQLVTIIVAVIGLVSSYIAAKYGKQYQTVKCKSLLLAELLDIVNSAVEDDTVTEEEFRAIMDVVMKLKK